MTQSTESRNTKRRDGVRTSDPVAAATTIHAGTLIALNAAGDAVPAGIVGAGAARSVANELADNSAGAAGDIRVEGLRGTFQFGNSAAGDLIARADIGATCYVADNQTVAKTDNTGAREVAGKVIDVDAGGVWVEVG